jgi:hypothetical protein
MLGLRKLCHQPPGATTGRGFTTFSGCPYSVVFLLVFGYFHTFETLHFPSDIDPTLTPPKDSR